MYFSVCLWHDSPQWAMVFSSLKFLDHTQRRTTVVRTPLDDWSALRTDLYLTTHSTHNRQISMTPARFDPKISAGEWPQTYALDRAATGMGSETCIAGLNSRKSTSFYMTTFSASLTNLMVPLPQSHDCSCYVNRRIQASSFLWLQKCNDLRACDFAHSPDL